MNVKNLEARNERFNEDLERLIAGELSKNHVFNLGRPGVILQRAGFPANQDIEVTAERIKFKSALDRHPYDIADLKNLVKAINAPVAVFEYKTKSKNIIIDTQKDGKNYLAGIYLEQKAGETQVSSIRTLFPKDNHEWLNWIPEGKLRYADTKKLQDIVTQQQMNSADVSHFDLEAIQNLLGQNKNVKHLFFLTEREIPAHS